MMVRFSDLDDAAPGKMGREMGRKEDVFFSAATDASPEGATVGINFSGDDEPGGSVALDGDRKMVRLLYRTSLSVAEHLVRVDSPSRLEELVGQVKVLVERFDGVLEEAAPALVEMVFRYPVERTHYQAMNLVNVAIGSMIVGRCLGFTPELRVELGVCGFLHDVGMGAVIEIADRPQSLSPEEKDQLKEHVSQGGRLLEAVRGIGDRVKAVVRMEHERADGSGYPTGLVNGQIDEFAQVVGMVDIYESLTHDRPHRRRRTPQEAVRELTLQPLKFDARLIKALVKSLGLFPPGTFVLLNTREVAKVICNNPETPFSPVVEVVFDEVGRRVSEGRRIDLARSSRHSVVRSLG